MSITIRELAQQLGVSHSVVSSVLNGKNYCGVSERRRQEILIKAKEMNCQPHAPARALKNGRSDVVGICMPASSLTAYSALLLSQQKMLMEQGYLSLFSFWQVPEISPEIFRQELQNAFKTVFSHQAAGIIAWYYDDCLKRENIPTVLFGCSHEGFDSVAPDFVGQSRLAVDHLAGLGHRRLAYIGFKGVQENMTRLAIRDRGLPADDSCICADKNLDAFQFAGEMLPRLLALPEPPTGIICHNREFALGVIIEAGILGLRIPESLSLVSMGMNNRNSDRPYPAVTSAGTNGGDSIGLTVKRLIERIRQPALPAQSFLIAPELIDRGSCAPPPKRK